MKFNKYGIAKAYIPGIDVGYVMAFIGLAVGRTEDAVQ